MKYYKLEYNNLNIKETGTQFQCVDGYLGDIQSNIFPIEGKIDFNFKLPEPLMQDKAKPTTLLNAVFTANGFMIFKNYFINFLDDFNVDEFQTWKIKVHHKKQIYSDYCLFNIIYPQQRNLINYSKSSFYLGKFSDYLYVGQDLKIDNYDNYLSTQDVLKMMDDNFLKCRKVILNLNEINIDMFKLWLTPLAGYYVSEKLKKAIEEQRFTGMVFKEITNDKKIEVIY